MILSSTTDKLVLVTDYAVEIDVVTGFIDRDSTTGAIGTAYRQSATITTATSTDIVSAPSSGITRKINRVVVRNVSSSPSDISIRYSANGTIYEIHNARLYAQDRLEYCPEKGFTVLKASTEPFFYRAVRSPNHAFAVGTPGGYIVFGMHAQLPRRDPGATPDRRYGIFALYSYYTAVSTTGFRPGIFQNIGATFGPIGGVQITTPSTSSATIAALSGATDGSLLAYTDSPGASGVPGFLGGGGTDNNGSSGYPIENAVSFAINTEVNASVVTLNSVPCYVVFENTE